MDVLYGFLEELRGCLSIVESRIPTEKDSHARAELRAESKTYRKIIAQYKVLIHQVERQRGTPMTL